jgi:hypothetical protein
VFFFAFLCILLQKKYYKNFVKNDSFKNIKFAKKISINYNHPELGFRLKIDFFHKKNHKKSKIK